MKAARAQAELELPGLYPKQYAAIYAPERYAVIEASTKAGKTAGCMTWLLDQAWTKGGPNRNFWWVAPISGQSDIAFRRFLVGLTINGRPPKSNRTIMTIQLPNGSTLWFKSSDKPDSLYGEDVYAAVIDEATRVKEGAWYAVRSTLTKTRGPIRIIGNVKGRKNWAYTMARQAESGAPDMAYAKLTAYDAVDAGVLALEEVEDAKRTLPEHAFRELYLAEPADDGGNPFGLDAIASCVGQFSTDRPACWGWDLAKSIDWTVGVALDRLGRVCRLERFQAPWHETRRRIQAATGHTPALIDSTGVGDPIVEDLQRQGLNAEGFRFSATSKQQLMEGLAAVIQTREITIPDGVLRQELDTFEYVYTRTGAIYSAPEGLHDDCVCALALAVARWRSVPTSLPIVVGKRMFA